MPVELPLFSEQVEFGTPMKEKHFLLDVSDGLYIYTTVSAEVVILTVEILGVSESWCIWSCSKGWN